MPRLSTAWEASRGEPSHAICCSAAASGETVMCEPSLSVGAPGRGGEREEVSN